MKKMFKDLSGDDLIKMITSKQDKFNVLEKNTKYGTDILLVPMAFDIETTNDLDTQSAYMYIWQFAIYDNVIYGRTWDEFIALNNKLLALINKFENAKFVVLIHNLSYEWQFMRKYLSANYKLRPFLLENRKPVTVDILINDLPKITYQDSLMLSQCGLKKTAETYCKTKKLPDFEYDTPRNHLTKLSDRELEYCANDVLILTEYYEYLIEHVIVPNQFFPITQTQIPRNDVKNAWKSWKKGKNNPNKYYISNLFPPSYEQYQNDMNYLFRGGYTHANAENAYIIIEDDILHSDFTSSYPAVLLHDYFPISAFKKVTFDEKYLDTHCCKMLVKFTNIRTKTSITYDSISKLVCDPKEYKNKLKEYNVYDDNGRLYSADTFIVYITELDYKIYEKIYDWDKKEVIKFSIAERGILPNYLRNLIVYYYSEKAKIKKYGDPKGKDKTKYEYFKRMVNSLYGMMCTKLNVVDLNYVDDCYVEEIKDLDWNTVKSTAFLSPYWGIWCTAHARYHLFDLIIKLIEIGHTEWYYYSDTDSHFCKDTEFIRNYFKEYNEKIAEQNKEFDELLSDLGEFDLEHSPETTPIFRFKTLGAKRYMIETVNKKGNKTIIATIAGLPKTFHDKEDNEYNLLEYYANIQHKDAFELFTDELVLDELIAHKNANSYNDEETTTIIDGVEETTKSGIFIYPITFKLMMTFNYKSLINNLHTIKERRIKG